jgi:hypothetical protein
MRVHTGPVTPLCVAPHMAVCGRRVSSPQRSCPTYVHQVLHIAMRKYAYSSGLRFKSQHMATGMRDLKSLENSKSSFNIVSSQLLLTRSPLGGPHKAAMWRVMCPAPTGIADRVQRPNSYNSACSWYRGSFCMSGGVTSPKLAFLLQLHSTNMLAGPA